jgi:hopanoid-associated phosphorylase
MRNNGGIASDMRLSLIGLAILLASSVPVRAHAGGCEVLVVVGLEYEAEVAAGPDVKVVISAANADLLRKRLANVDVTRLNAVVSFGIAGALDEDLEVGDLRVATRVVSGEQVWRADPGMRSAFRSQLGGVGGPEYEETVFLGNDELTGVDAEANRALHRESGADVVDMESHLGAEFAQHNDLPFAAIRSISDTAHQELPPAALVPLLPDGSGDWKAVLKSVIRHPSQIPELWTVVKGFDAAMETLRAVRKRLNLADLVQQPASGLCVGSGVWVSMFSFESRPQRGGHAASGAP